MKNSPLILIILALAFAQTANAAKTVAVLEIVQELKEINVSIAEIRHLTDELRRQATLALPQKDYSVLTRDNLLQLMPQNEEEAERLAAGSVLDIGKAIGAEYMSQGKISKFGTDLSLAIELYECEKGKLLGNIIMESPDIKGLMAAIREQAPDLFAKIIPPDPTPPPPPPPPINLEPSPPQIAPEPPPPQTAQSNTKNFTYVAIGLDILGAACLGVGIYQNSQKKHYYSRYENPEIFDSQKEHAEELQKAKDASRVKNAAFAIGGTLLALGIGVHIWF